MKTWFSINCQTRKYSPRNSPRQSAIAEGFAEANSVCIAITSVKILPRWLFHSKIYIQFTIFNTYFSTKLLFTNSTYHLHVHMRSVYYINFYINFSFESFSFLLSIFLSYFLYFWTQIKHWKLFLKHNFWCEKRANCIAYNNIYTTKFVQQ